MPQERRGQHRFAKQIGEWGSFANVEVVVEVGPPTVEVDVEGFQTDPRRRDWLTGVQLGGQEKLPTTNQCRSTTSARRSTSRPSARRRLHQTPQAYGIFTGHVVEAAKRQNELSGHFFYWSLVDSLGDLFDVVIDPELVQNEPKVGGVLSGSFWLSGRLVTQ